MSFGKARKPQPVGEERKRELESAIPVGVDIAGQWSWRILAMVGVAIVLGLIVIQLREIVIPFMIAVLVSALLVPVAQFLVRHRWPKALAVAVTMVGTLAVIGGLILLIITQIRSGFPDIQSRSVTAFEDFKTFLASSPLQISDADFNAYLDQAFNAIQTDSQALVSGALSVGSTAGHVLTGFLLVLFATLFILIDGRGIWNWIVRLFPRKARPAVDGSGRAGWITLTAFVKVQILVAFIDAVGIGLGAWILGLVYGGFPLLIPITVAVFLGSFIPVVGAVVTGALAVLVALLYLNPLAALIMLAIVLVVQQVEGHLLQPLVMGTAVKVHPLAVVFAVAAGSYLAGIAGALFAVPVVAVVNVMVNYVATGKWRATQRPQAKDVADLA
jgi:predicted PurR-regulated permease PerM